MRIIVLLALVGLMTLGGLFVVKRADRSPVEMALDVVRGDRREAPALSGESGESERAEDDPVFYQYIDDAGRVRFVQSPDDVPAKWRDSIGRVELSPGRIVRPQTPTPGRAAATRPPEVVVYTTPWCGWCRKTLAWLDERGVHYVNKDIEANETWRDELVRKTGSASIPFVEIDDQTIRGFSPQRMRKALQRG